jgi:hypothetical protein
MNHMNEASAVALVRDRFSWDDGGGGTPWFEGFHDPAQRWNGWACPLFSKDEGLRVAELSARLAAEDPEAAGEVVAWDEDRSLFTVSDPARPGEPAAEVGPVVLGGQVLYPIGSRAWTWSEQGLPD